MINDVRVIDKKNRRIDIQRIDFESSEAYHKAYAKLWRKKNKERLDVMLYNWRIQNVFGLSLEEYDALVEKQNNRCAICGTDEPGGRNRRWQIDHCHKTGKVRGLLCQACNFGLGKFKDDVEIVEKAVRYLRDQT